MTAEERITAKLVEAKEQLAGWQQQLSTAAEQVTRWDAVRQACEELLAAQKETPTS